MSAKHERCDSDVIVKFRACVLLGWDHMGSRTREQEGVEKTHVLPIKEDYLSGKGSLPLLCVDRFR